MVCSAGVRQARGQQQTAGHYPRRRVGTARTSLTRRISSLDPQTQPSLSADQLHWPRKRNRSNQKTVRKAALSHFNWFGGCWKNPSIHSSCIRVVKRISSWSLACRAHTNHQSIIDGSNSVCCTRCHPSREHIGNECPHELFEIQEFIACDGQLRASY